MKPIVLEDVRRAFGRKAVLDGFSADADAGRVIGLLGRNGEGKTTLFKVMLDLLQADSGRVEVLGLRPDASGAIRARVGYVPERPVFDPRATVSGVLDLRAGLFPGWDRARAAALCRRLALDPSAPVAGASKGTLGKLAWVCAAAHDPALYLLDEPTSGLDALVREEVLAGLVAELSSEGKTVLVTSHRMDELSGLLDEVWLMGGGRLAGRWSMDDLRAQGRVVSARVRDGRTAPAPAGAVPLAGEGPVRRWAVLDAGARERLLADAALEAPSVTPLKSDQIFPCLLSLTGGPDR